MTTIPAPAHSTSGARTGGEGAQPAARKIWIDGVLLDRSEAKVSVYDHGYLYGDGIFEGIRIYGGRIFKLASHLKRLLQSAEMIRLKLRWSVEEIDRAVRQTVEANGLRDGYIRLVVSRGVGSLGLNPFKCPQPTMVVIADSIELYPAALYESGMKIIVAQRPRIPISCLDPAVKSLNYLNNILAKIEAVDAGVLEAIMLNLDGEVAECTGDNVFLVRGREILTPPKTAGILHGVTRQFVMTELAPACGCTSREAKLRVADFVQADEVFLTGTAAEIIGVTQIGEKKVASGSVGTVTRALTAEFRRRVAMNAPED